jgi:hypothetical protein
MHNRCQRYERTFSEFAWLHSRPFPVEAERSPRVQPLEIARDTGSTLRRFTNPPDVDLAVLGVVRGHSRPGK